MYNENIFKRLYNLFIDYKNYTNYTFSWMIKLIKIKKNDDTCRKNNKFHWAKKMHNAGNSYSVMILFIHPDITQCLLINRRARACWKKNCKFLQKKKQYFRGTLDLLIAKTCNFTLLHCVSELISPQPSSDTYGGTTTNATHFFQTQS